MFASTDVHAARCLWLLSANDYDCRTSSPTALLPLYMMYSSDPVFGF